MKILIKVPVLSLIKIYKMFNSIMKLYLQIIFTLVLSALSIQCASAYNIQLNANNAPIGDVIFARYYGKSFIAIDTLQHTPNSVLVFNENKLLPEGLYSFIFSDKSHVDLLVTLNQELRVALFFDELLFPIVEGDVQSMEFAEYGHMVFDMQRQRQKVQQYYGQYRNNSDSIKTARLKLNALNQKMNDYYLHAKQTYKGKFLEAIFSVLQSPTIPTILSPAQQWYYQKNNSFNRYPFTDARLVNTPFLANSIEIYLQKSIEQMPDTLVKYAVKVIEKSKANPKVFQQVCNDVFSYAINSEIMGIDKLQVEIAKRYYLSNDAFWVDEAFKQKAKALVKKSEAVLIGNTAPKLTLMSANEQEGFLSLHDIKAKYTLIVFWEPNCHYCNIAVPEIKKISDQYKPSELTIYAVCTQPEKEEWEKYIFEKDLHRWINVTDANNQSDYKSVYDVAVTPMLYLLDSDKKIMAKKFDYKQLDNILKRLAERGSIY